MGDDDRDAMREMHAHPEEIARNFREALHRLMRAVCSQDENTTALSEAMFHWRFMLQGMADCKERLYWPDIFTQAVRFFRETDRTDRRRSVIDGPSDEVNYWFREVARTGMSVYIDDDDSKKLYRFMEAIRRLEEARK
jgi:hypothetical protein